MKITSNAIKKQFILGAVSAIGALVMTWAVKKYLVKPKEKAKVIQGNFGGR